MTVMVALSIVLNILRQSPTSVGNSIVIDLVMSALGRRGNGCVDSCCISHLKIAQYIFTHWVPVPPPYEIWEHVGKVLVVIVMDVYL